MRELQKRQIIKKRIYSLPVLVILIIVVSIALKGTYGVFKKRQESAERIVSLEKKITSLEVRNEDLKDYIERLDTREGIDEEIKEKFSVTKEGEEVAVIVDPRTTGTTTEEADLHWYKRWWNAVSNLWH
jgi:cell division protein FtsB